MSVAEIISYIRYRSMDEQEYKICEAVVAALKAGQAMRDAIVIANVTGTPVQINTPAAVAAKAWDAATKGDV